MEEGVVESVVELEEGVVVVSVELEKGVEVELEEGVVVFVEGVVGMWSSSIYPTQKVISPKVSEGVRWRRVTVINSSSYS